MTKLGRLVKANKIKSMEEIYLHSLPIKEYQIVDFFLPKLKDEVMKVRLTVHTSPRCESSEKEFQIADAASRDTRSSPCKSKPALVNVPASRPLSSSVILKDTLVWESRPPKK